MLITAVRTSASTVRPQYDLLCQVQCHVRGVSAPPYIFARSVVQQEFAPALVTLVLVDGGYGFGQTFSVLFGHVRA